MRVLLLVAVFALVLPLPTRADYHEMFSYPDGTFPPTWVWTGDPRGGGFFEVHDGAFTHVSGGHVHYFRDADQCGRGVYRLDVRGTDWVFAWRVDAANPQAGTCYCIYHNDYWGWAYNFVEFEWTTLAGYPEGQYMWHNGWHTRIEHHPADPSETWVNLVIEDESDHVRVWVEGTVIFDIDVEPIPNGYIGVGSSGGGTMWPAFDNLRGSPGSAPVESLSWTRLKSLFR